MGILEKYRSQYRLSIEDFAEEVQAYIEKQPAGFRLNFFVDEVGQYIADNVKLMTNLQTIAESLATKCQGRAWIVVTAQEEDRKSTRLNSSHVAISYAVFCLKQKNKKTQHNNHRKNTL